MKYVAIAYCVVVTVASIIIAYHSPLEFQMYDRDELIKRRDELMAKIERLEDIHLEVLEILYEIRFHNGMMDIVDAYANEAINKLTRYQNFPMENFFFDF